MKNASFASMQNNLQASSFLRKNMCALQPSSYSESSGGAADGLDIIVFKIMINK